MLNINDTIVEKVGHINVFSRIQALEVLLLPEFVFLQVEGKTFCFQLCVATCSLNDVLLE